MFALDTYGLHKIIAAAQRVPLIASGWHHF
jgi:hypothetical protein